MKKAQLVFIPSPGVGHLASTINFANLLINHNPHLSITVLVIKLPFHSHTHNKTDSLTSSSDRMQIIDLPYSDHSQDVAEGSSIEKQKPQVKQAVFNLTRSDHSAPPLAAFVVDMFCTSMIDVAKEFNVPALLYFTSGVAALGLVLHLHTLRERHNVTATELSEGSNTELVIPCFANAVPTRVLPTLALSEELNPSFISYVSGLKRADGIIVNSFEELEPHAVHSFSDADLPIYPVGPILNLKLESTWDDSEIAKWLNAQPLTSVVFLCFGSLGSFHEEQVREIACALEVSGARFLWSLRKPSPKGSRAPPSDYTITELDAVLPQGFLDRTNDIGRVIGWAPQTQVLAHNAIGGFVSHCGWNSILESIYFGVPIATWPHYAEQQPNAFELVHELNLAVEIALDYRKEPNGESVSNYLLKAEKIEKGIRSVLKQDGEIRKKVNEMSEISRKTLMEGGSSHSHLERLMDYISNQA